MSSLHVSAVLSTSSFLCSVQDTFNMRRQIHISNASVFLKEFSSV